MTRSLSLIGMLTLATVTCSDVFALDLLWTRNVEEDMKQYHVYVCKVAGCTATDRGLDWIASVPQPPVGTVPRVTLPANIVGAAAVTAEDQAGNLSGASVSLPFSTMPPDLAPGIPQGLRTE